MNKKPKKFYKKAGKKRLKKTSGETHVLSQELPRNTRSITESKIEILKNPSTKIKKYRYLLIIILCALIGFLAVCGIFSMSGTLKRGYNDFTLVEQERGTLQLQVSQWQEEALLHPGSRDVYMRLALLTYQLRDLTKAKAFVDRALLLDPNYPPALQLRKLLN